MLLLGLFSIIIVLARLHTYYEPLERDVTGYAVTANEISMGSQLYKDTWDHKPFGIHLTYYFFQQLFGYGRHSIFILNIFINLAAMLGIFFAGAAGPGNRIAGLYAAGFYCLLSGDLFLQANQPNTEIFINTVLIWALALFLKLDRHKPDLKTAVIIGLLFTMGTVYKQIAIMVPICMATCYTAIALGDRQNLKIPLYHTGVMALVGFVAWMLIFSYFFLNSRLDDFTLAIFQYNSEYAHGLLTNILRSFSPEHLVPGFLTPLIPFILLSITAVIAGSLSQKNKTPFLLLGSFILASQIMIALPGRFHPHYYQLWIPTAVIGSGWLIVLLTNHFSEKSKSYPHLLGPHFLGITLLLFLLRYELPLYGHSAREWSYMKYGNIFIMTDQLAKDLNQQLAPEDTIYEWGNESGLYLLTGKRPLSCTLSANVILMSKKYGPYLIKKDVAKLKKNPPDLIIHEKSVPSMPLDQKGLYHPDWLLKDYYALSSQAYYQTFYLYVRKGSALDVRLSKKRKAVKSTHE
jgi:hypothetical protein